MAHRKCPQAWVYGFERGLRKLDPDDIAVERAAGIWWHALLAADAIERGRGAGTIAALPTKLKCDDEGTVVRVDEAVNPNTVLDALGSWWKRLPSTEQEAYVERLGEALPERLSALLDRYFDRWLAERALEHPLAVELRWERALVSKTGVGAPQRLVGYVDEVYLDVRRGLVVARDHKLHRALATQTTADDMMDSQLQLYAWGAGPAVAALGHGSIRATAYNRARMVAPKSPAVTQAGTLSKSVTDYDLQTYLEWAQGPDGRGVPYPGRMKDGSKAGLYTAEDSVVEKLSAPAARSAWFQRTLTPLNANLIKAHLRAVLDTARDRESTRETYRSTRLVARNLTKGCRYCDFVGLCRAEMVGGPDGDYDLTVYKLTRR